MSLYKTPWIDSNIFQVDYFQPRIPEILLERLSVKLMSEEELKNNDLYFDDLDNIVGPRNVPKNAKVVISTNPINKTIYPNQYYFQGSSIKELDIEVVSFDDLPNSVNLVVSGQTISNLQYYEDNLVVKYNLYMYHMHSIESEDKFSQFLSANKSNIMKYTNIHLLELSSYYLVKYLCDTTNTTGKKINLYVYDENDIKILTEIFENDITIGSNVTINLYIGWWFSSSSQTLFLNYMNLILKMSEYKMRNYGTDYYKKFKVFDKTNTETLSENYLHFGCVSVLLERYIKIDKNTTEDYKACLLALKNLELLNSTTENTNDKITKMNNEYAGKIQSINTKYTRLKTNIDSNNTQLKTLETKIDTNNTQLKNLETKIDTNNTDVSSTIKSLNNDIINHYASKRYVNQTITKSLENLSQKFGRMKMDSEKTTNSVNASYVVIVLFIMMFLIYIILINIRTSKKKK